MFIEQLLLIVASGITEVLAVVFGMLLIGVGCPLLECQ